MKRVFVDTWYALTDAADSDDAMVQLAMEELLSDRTTLVTTNFVLDETLTLIRYNVHHAAAVHFWYTLQRLGSSGLVEIVRVDESYEALAWQIFERYADQEFSYTDCTSFAVMQALNLTEILTADRHFATMGFTLVP